MTDIQGLFTINPKEYFVKNGNLHFPFKNVNEVLAYFLGLSKIKKLINQKMKNEAGSPKLKCINKNMLFHSYSYNYSIANCINGGERGNRTFLLQRFFNVFSMG